MHSNLTLTDAIPNFDVESYVISHGGEEIKDGEYVLDCPTCGKDKLTVNTYKNGVWHCWVCEEYSVFSGKKKAKSGAGSLLDLVGMLEGISKYDAVKYIIQQAKPSHVPIGFIPEGSKPMLAEIIPEPVAIPYPPNWAAINEPLPFMDTRGLTMENAYQFGLFYCTEGRYGNRLVFPVYEEGVFVYFQARAMWEPSPGQHYVKALNPPKQEGAAVSTQVLMNLDQARHHKRVIITEGPIDAIKTGPDAICTFGKAISPLQIAKLLRSDVKAIDLMWDADAQDAMYRMAPLLAGLFDLRLVLLPQGDPGEYDTYSLRQMINQAQPYTSSLRSI